MHPQSKLLSIGGIMLIIAVLLSFQLPPNKENRDDKKGLIKVTILYPNGEGKKFDMEYYAGKHMPMLASLLGDSLKYYAIDKGISGRTAEDPIPYLAIGYLYFDRLSAYQNAFKAHAQQIRGDITNYTNIQPIVQISEVVK